MRLKTDDRVTHSEPTNAAWRRSVVTRPAERVQVYKYSMLGLVSVCLVMYNCVF